MLTHAQKLSSNINKSIEQQMVNAASVGKLTIMANKGGDKVEPYVSASTLTMARFWTRVEALLWR
jgi:hypothetical protein